MLKLIRWTSVGTLILWASFIYSSSVSFALLSSLVNLESSVSNGSLMDLQEIVSGGMSLCDIHRDEYLENYRRIRNEVKKQILNNPDNEVVINLLVDDGFDSQNFCLEGEIVFYAEILWTVLKECFAMNVVLKYNGHYTTLVKTRQLLKRVY